MTPPQDAQRLIAAIQDFSRVVVAMSGGVDSSVVAAAAHAAKLDSAIAITADSPSVPRWQLDTAKRIADEIGIQHTVVATHEGDRPEYIRNDKRRCYFCKDTLYSTLNHFATQHPGTTILSGTNADDLGDYRPGIEAGKQANVATPLADLGIDKLRVRDLAKYFGLSNHDLPAAPCLASRIAYGTEVTPERLSKIEQAEDWLRANGFAEFRVRLHAEELARIEVPQNQIPDLVRLDQNGEMTDEFLRIGFQFVTIDLQGFRSGSMNRVLVSIGEAQTRQTTHSQKVAVEH